MSDTASMWVVARLLPDREAFEVNGVYSTREKAVRALKPREVATRFVVDADYTDVTEFEMVSYGSPEHRQFLQTSAYLS